MITKKKALTVRVPLEYLSFDEDDRPVMNGSVQAIDLVVVELRRRSDGEKKERTFNSLLDGNSQSILEDFCGLLLSIEGFADFPEYTPETLGDVAFDYFNDPNMVEYVEQFMLGYQKRTYPADFFRGLQVGGVEVPATQPKGLEAGA